MEKSGSEWATISVMEDAMNEAAESLRFTNEYSTVMEIVTRYGGEQVIAGPPMDRMVNELTEAMLAERKAMVDRIRTAFEAAPAWESRRELLRILDAEAKPET